MTLISDQGRPPFSSISLGNSIFATPVFWQNNLYVAGAWTLKRFAFNGTTKFNGSPFFAILDELQISWCYPVGILQRSYQRHHLGAGQWPLLHSAIAGLRRYSSPRLRRQQSRHRTVE